VSQREVAENRHRNRKREAESQYAVPPNKLLAILLTNTPSSRHTRESR
jgi:hypothetical protein